MFGVRGSEFGVRGSRIDFNGRKRAVGIGWKSKRPTSDGRSKIPFMIERNPIRAGTLLLSCDGVETPRIANDAPCQFRRHVQGRAAAPLLGIRFGCREHGGSGRSVARFEEISIAHLSSLEPMYCQKAWETICQDGFRSDRHPVPSADQGRHESRASIIPVAGMSLLDSVRDVSNVVSRRASRESGETTAGCPGEVALAGISTPGRVGGLEVGNQTNLPRGRNRDCPTAARGIRWGRWQMSDRGNLETLELRWPERRISHRPKW
jgi:hypothetical protein